jgi:hypothetical protein
MARYPFESPWLYGIHDPGGEALFREFRRPGWIVVSETIGHDPTVRSGVDYRHLASREYAVICRLNNGSFPEGTIPHSSRYADFAQRCSNFVAASPGCCIWVIGNEPNFAGERPNPHGGPVAGKAPPALFTMEPVAEEPRPATFWGRVWRWLRGSLGLATRPVAGDAGRVMVQPAAANADPGRRGAPERFGALTGHAPSAEEEIVRQSSGEEMITPSLYARCYRLCRDAIHAVPGHERDLVVVAAVAPWNNQTTYAGNDRGDWVRYFADVLDALQDSGCDGIALHAYTLGASPAQVTADSWMRPPFEDRRCDFRAYEDFMAAIPPAMRELPVYITETDQVDPWQDVNSGWVQRAYREVERWNRQPGAQTIRALVLYRWQQQDRWAIQGKRGVMEDLRAALAHDYRWDVEPEEPRRLRRGVVLEALRYLNVRRTPGYVGKGAEDVVGALVPGDRMKILEDGNVEEDGLTWWRVRTLKAQPVEGWVAQYGPDGTVYVAQVDEPAPPAAEPAFARGDRVRSTAIVMNARRSPGILGKPADDVIAEIPASSILVIEDGPVAADDMPWWRVSGDALGGAREAWVAERSPAGEVLLVRDDDAPSPPQPGPRFRPGDRAMTLNYVRLRRSPGFMSKPADDVIADIWQGTLVSIVAGPVEADELSWLQVDTTDVRGQTVRGWMAVSAPGGIPLLGSWVDQDRMPLVAGDIAVVGAVAAAVRRTPGFRNKPNDDVLGEYMARFTVLLTDGPQQADGLQWWRASGISRGRPALGWVAEGLPEGGRLLGRAVKLPGTDIPNLRVGTFLGLPYAGRFGISQLWGENPGFYGRYSYDGVPLRGHNGIDFLTPSGTTVLATDTGVVAEVGFEPGGFGNYVLIVHEWGESFYAHLQSTQVQVGMAVTRGAAIGRSGNSGGSTGPHLHFALRIRPYQRGDGWGGYSDPLPYLNPQAVAWPDYMRLGATGVPGETAPGDDRMPPPRMAEDAPGLVRP